MDSTHTLYHSGEVVKLLKYGRSGFIRDVLGKEYYFNSDAEDTPRLKKGSIVIFTDGEKIDKKKKKLCPVALNIQLVSL